VEEMLALGAQAEKLVLGIPAYGRETTNPDNVSNYHRPLHRPPSDISM
jgi:GH18 family chitinase